MKKNPNKTAGNWGALKNKPQNLVPFKSGGKVTVTAGGEKHVIYKKTTKQGEGKVGNVMVNHPTKDKGVWDTIDLTKKSGAKTLQQGVASTKKWHKENPYNDMKKQLTKKYQNGGNTAADKVAEQRAINAKRKAEALARTEKSKTDARAKIDQAQKNKPVTKPAEPVAQTTAPVRRNPENDYLVKNAGKDNTKAQIGVRTQAYNYENKGITKNKINLLGRGVTKTKTDQYLVPAKDVRFSDTDSPEITRRKLGYLSDKSDQQKTGTQKTRTVTNLKKGTIKNVTRSTGSYVKDGEKKRVVTKSTIPGKSNSGAMKKGGSVKKYQTGGTADSTKYKSKAEALGRTAKAMMDDYTKIRTGQGIFVRPGGITVIPTPAPNVTTPSPSKSRSTLRMVDQKGNTKPIEKKGGTKKYQNGGPMKKASPTPPMMSPYMDRATKAKMASPKTRDLEAQMKKAADRRGFYDSIKPIPKKKK